jgi:hypothetical protein
MWAAVLPGRDYFKAKLGRIQQGDSEKSGTTFRPEKNSFQTKKLCCVQVHASPPVAHR